MSTVPDRRMKDESPFCLDIDWQVEATDERGQNGMKRSGMPGHAGPNSKASGPVQESLLRLLAERSRDMIFRYRLRPEPGFEYVSPGVKHFSGYTPEEHYADPYLGDRTIHPDDWPILTALQQGVVPVEPVRVRWIRKDGSICWTEAEVMLERDEEGNVVALEGIVHDVTVYSMYTSS